MTCTLAQSQARALLKDFHHTLLYGGSRSGKTFLLTHAIVVRALKAPGTRHLIVRHRFAHVKSSIWYQTIPAVLAVDGVTVKQNKTDWFMTFPNGSEIWCGGLDDKERVEKILGNEYSTVYFNEVSQIGYDSIIVGLTRLAEKSKLTNKAYYDCNPPSPLHWAHKLFIEGIDPKDGEPLKNPGLYASMLMNPGDNAENLPDRYIDDVLDNLPERARRRFLLGEWVKAEGAIYEAFKDDAVIPYEMIPDIERYVVGLDFGLNMAAVLVGRAGDNIYVVDDMGTYNATASAFDAEMQAKWGQYNYDIVYCDPSGGERIQEIAYGDKANNSVDPGIDYINAAIESGRFFVCEQAHGVLSEIYDYRRDEKERVVKENDHHLDAMRYGIFSEAQYGDVFAGYVEI